MCTEFIYSDRDALFQRVAERCAGLLRDDVTKFGQASFIVPGGTTPAPVFKKLSMMQLPWHKISITPSDERWISVDHKQSNQNLIEQTLLINYASTAQVIGLKNTQLTTLKGEALTDLNIKKLKHPFSVTVVGMGTDGHFASLFPGAPQIDQALDLNQQKRCIAIDAQDCPVTGDYTQRMSMTLASLVDSNLVIVLITGQQKLDVIHHAAEQKENFDLPVSALLKQTQTPVEIYWAE